MSVQLDMAVDAHRRVVRAERKLELRKKELERALRRLPSHEVAAFVKATTER